MGFRTIKGYKIREMRGNRSLQDIVDAAGHKFTRSALWQWEQAESRIKPSDANVPALLAALGCSYEDISEPVEALAA